MAIGTSGFVPGRSRGIRDKGSGSSARFCPGTGVAERDPGRIPVGGPAGRWAQGKVAIRNLS